jgi:hypothetical protein
MKITIDVDCTPEEARAFLGLPDVAPMQDAVLARVQERLLDGLTAMEPEALFKVWLPAGLQGWEQMQKQFWSQMAGAAGRSGPDEKGPGKKGPGKKEGE